MNKLMILAATFLFLLACEQKTTTRAPFSEPQKEAPKPLNWKGRINTIVDGHDVKVVHVWHMKNKADGRIQAQLTKDEYVTILHEDGPYYYITVRIGSRNKAGYVMKEFVTDIEK